MPSILISHLRWLRWIVLLALLSVFALACGGDGDETPTPQSDTPTSGPEETITVNTIAYVGLDSNIYTIRPDGTDEKLLTLSFEEQTVSLLPAPVKADDILYNWPTWSPDATKIAFSGFSPDGQSAALYVIDAEGGLPTKLYDNPPEAVGRSVASNSPHYIYWSPDSRNIAFLAPSASSLSLLLLEATDLPTASGGLS